MSARELAEQASRTYLSDPAEARRLATEARSLATAGRDWGAVSAADRVLGRIAGHLDDSRTADLHFRSAARTAERAGDDVGAARARSDLAYVLVRQGRSAAALREIERARPLLAGSEPGELLTTEALVLRSLGRWHEALDVLGRAVDAIRRAGDQHELAVVLANRAVLELVRGELAGAQRDLEESRGLLAGLGDDLHQVILTHNFGYLAALRNQVPEALAHYAAAEAGYARHREVPPELWRDQCELLLASGLAAEAREAAEKAVDAAERRLEAGELAEARLRLAQAQLAEGDPHAAAAHAEAATAAFRLQRRTGWAALSRWVELEARLGLDAASVTDVELRRAAVQLERAGWSSYALDARLQAARCALERGAQRRGLDDLERLRALRRAGGPVWHQHLGWHAEALLRRHRGDRTGALRAAVSGLALVDDYRDSLGATDLRAAASARAAALADLGLHVALDDRRPEVVLQWAERTRAAALLRPSVRPPADPELDAELAQLRQVMSLRREAVQGGRADPALVERQVALERSIRARTRTVSGAAGEPVTRVPPPRRLVEALGDAALVEYANAAGRLYAVTLVAGRLELTELGPVVAVERELHHAFFALRRLVLGSARAQESVEASGERLDDLLVRPLLPQLGDRDLVVVPTDPLHATPWSLLPSCRGRSLTVSPSATVWLEARRRSASGGRTVLVAGPDLEHAESEVAVLSQLHPDAEVLVGSDATAARVLAAMEGADLVHVAAHGRFRGDNPQFSSLELVDGPLTVYDIEQVRRPPLSVVLSACEVGRSSVSVGDELLGLAAAMLSLGVRSLVAPLLLVPDAETEPLMIDLHRELVAGRSPAAALAGAAGRALGRSGADAAAGSAFVSFGA
ncbi:CHAT domain-containing protein [Motilibacter peucedani]|uniref:CHAT domain-containing protein n=1 Tax=Motilibacter peucedani TaxID=598650 RepID=A0A420XUW7_9ACTN|nr:CHAT domain-containing protein [Motilibacter peucedani]RKS80449.1 CHAT domain-containing protein [Motilibacter peucedani]